MNAYNRTEQNAACALSWAMAAVILGAAARPEAADAACASSAVCLQAPAQDPSCRFTSATLPGYNGGPASNRIDLVFVGDGYRASDLAKYASDVDAVVAALFAESPLRDYKTYFNVHRVDVVSPDPQAGIDRPLDAPAVCRTTALDVSYDSVSCPADMGGSSIGTEWPGKITNAALNAPAADITLVLANDTRRAGCSGGLLGPFAAVVAMPAPASGAAVAAHEFGHAFGGLADEFGGTGMYVGAEPDAVNATRRMDPTSSTFKWNAWVGSPVQTVCPAATPDTVGLFAGALGFNSGVFRPTCDSKMSDETKPWRAVNTEELVKQIYRAVTLIESRTPAANVIDLPGSAEQVFTVQPLAPGATRETTPWQTGATGSLRTDYAWHYAMGYHFTPQTSGRVTALGAFVNGTKTVRLFDRATGAVLATATVTAANAWSYAPIAPVTLQMGRGYTVAVYLAGTGGSWRSGIAPLPRTIGDIRIESSTYIATNTNPSARPINSLTISMYGQADVRFEGGTASPVQVNWLLDGTPVQIGGTTYRLNPLSLTSGTHQFSVVVEDLTPLVRNRAPTNVLRDTVTWTLNVPVRPFYGDLNGDGWVSISELIRGVAIALNRPPAPTAAEMTALDQDLDGQVEIHELLLAVNNALRGPDAPVVRIAMDTSQDGAIDVAELTVWMQSQAAGSAPVFGALPASVSALPGQLASIALTATDADGDAVAFSSQAALPSGAQLLPLGNVTMSGTLSSLDATWIQEYVNGTRTFTPAQVLLADASRNGSIAALDADWISQVLAGSRPPFNTAIFLWTPTSAQAGLSVSVAFIARDPTGQQAIRTVTITVGTTGGSAQHPWQAVATGTLYTNILWNQAMGYHFTPQVNGQVTGLGAFVNGTKTVRLFDRATGAVLATATVTSANSWNFAAITPVPVQAGHGYTVAVYTAGTGASWRSGAGLPRTSGSIRIDSSTYIATSTNPAARPVNMLTTSMYGQADIEFQPGQ